jgi:hypothetical protein
MRCQSHSATPIPVEVAAINCYCHSTGLTCVICSHATKQAKIKHELASTMTAAATDIVAVKALEVVGP